jgi:hypothetical protein
MTKNKTHPFVNFTHSAGAARVLLQKAHDEGSLIEGLVLYASSVDALLRNLVALKTGIPTRKGVISLDPRYFYHDDTKWMNERDIYKKAAEHKIITTREYEQLGKLYDFRNLVIHRFIISGITYSDIAPKLVQYERLFNKLYAKLKKIEQPQEPKDLSDEERADVFRRIADKLS